MKPIGAVIAIVGAAFFVWHLTKVVLGTDYGKPPLKRGYYALSRDSD